MQKLNKGDLPGIFAVDESKMHAPLPRSFQWADGSAFIHHVKLVRMARNAPLPETLETVPLMYQGASDCHLAPTEDIPQVDFNHGTDFEGEVGVIVDDTPIGITPEKALGENSSHRDDQRCFVARSDCGGIGAGLRFFPKQTANVFRSVRSHGRRTWVRRGARAACICRSTWISTDSFSALPMRARCTFYFGQLIAHAARTRPLLAGTIIGSGTVSNEDRARGSSCLAERRMLEKIHEGVMKTPFMKVGDTVRMEMMSETTASACSAAFSKRLRRSKSD